MTWSDRHPLLLPPKVRGDEALPKPLSVQKL